MKKASEKNMLARFRIGSVEAVGLEGAGYSPRGRRWGFFDSIQK